MRSYRAHHDISVLNDDLEVPGLGFLPVNAFVIRAAQPVVVDTGLGLPDRDFLASLAEVIDPADVGAPLPAADLATAEDAAAVNPDELRAAQLLWASVDSPWVHVIDPAKFAASLGPLRAFNPSAIFSTHLPPVTSTSAALFATLLDAPQADPFSGPDQAALEAMLRQFEPA